MRLKVRVRNTQFDVRDRYAASMNIPEFQEYTGEVLKRPSWVPLTSFCLSTGNKTGFKFRILEKNDIICGWRL